MHRERVNSSNLRSVGFKFWTNTLEIEFVGGGIYQYSRVPEERYERLMNAGSKGSYFHANIRNHFLYRKLN